MTGRSNQPRKRISMLAISIILLLSLVTGMLLFPSARSMTLPPMSLTLVAINGTEIVLDGNAIGNLTSIQAMGGYRKKTGAVTGPDLYEGPAFNTLCALIGGLTNDNALRLTSIDGYSQIFSYDQVNGEFATYNNSGQPVPHSQPLYPIIAYHKSGLNISSADGPLRVAIVGAEGLITDSQYWAKQAVKLEIRWRHDIAATSILSERASVQQGRICTVDVSLENQGGYDENFACKLYANNTLAATITTSLNARTTMILAFLWNTTGWQFGHYTLKAVADTVREETDTSDNTLTGNSIIITHIGDVNGDEKIDVQDISRVASAFGSTPYHSRWNAEYDINQDGRVDIYDVARTSRNFGWHL